MSPEEKNLQLSCWLSLMTSRRLCLGPNFSNVLRPCPAALQPSALSPATATRESGIRGQAETSESVRAQFTSKLSWQSGCRTDEGPVCLPYICLSAHVWHWICHSASNAYCLMLWKWNISKHLYIHMHCIYINTLLPNVNAPFKVLKFPYWQRMEGWVSLNSHYLWWQVVMAEKRHQNIP